MNSSSLVSVVMAAYNGGKYITQQIESILNQTYQNIELIVIDDCSTDNTRELVSEFCEKDARVNLVRSDHNKGVIETFQHGLKMARGEYIALSDQDDVFDPRKIEVLVKALESNRSADLVVSDLRLIDDDGDIISEARKAVSPTALCKFYNRLRCTFQETTAGYCNSISAKLFGT